MFARADNALARLAAFLLATATTVTDRVRQFVSVASRHIRISQQMPPPAFAA
jgi:hypothetical protein